MNEKDLLQKIKEDGRNTPIPDSLHPEAIEKMLREKYAGSSEQENVNSAASDTKNEKTIQKKTVSDSEAAPGKTVDMKEGARRRRMRSRFLRFGSAAAVFVLAFGVLLQSQQLKKHRQAEESQDIQSVTENLLARTVQEETENPAADADNNAEAQTDSAKKEAKVSEPDAFTYAESPKALYQALYDRFYSGSSDSYDTENGNPSSIARTDLAVPEMAADMSLSDLNSSDAGGISMYAEEDLYSSPEKAAGTDFSKTNLQELGVDEGDIVKTDGQFVYILRQDLSFAIVKADKDKSALLSVTKLDTGSNGYVHEMYLEGDTLHIIVSGAITRLTNEEDTYYTNTKRQTTLLTYDISDRSAPVLTGSVSQEGSYETSRKNDGYIYLFTSYSPDIRV